MIINPWIFYLIGVCDAICCICALTYTISIFLLILIFVFAILATVSDSQKDAKILIGISKKLLIICLISCFVEILVPSESTATKMLIASQVNETNVEHMKEVVDYIVEKVQEVKE